MKILGTTEKIFGKVAIFIIGMLFSFFSFIIASNLITKSDSVLNVIALVFYFLSAYFLIKTFVVTIKLFLNKKTKQNEKNFKNIETISKEIRLIDISSLKKAKH